MCSASLYSLKDLKSLAHQDEFREFFEHSKDIAPELRSNEWQKLNESTFKAYLRFMEKFSPIAERDFEALLKLNQWKILRNDGDQLVRMNMLLRNFLLDQLKRELNDKTLESIKIFWGQNHNDDSIGFPLGKSLLEKDPNNTLAVEMIKTGFLSSVSEVYCSDPSVQPMIKNQLRSLLENLGENQSFDVLMAKYINRKCWDSLKTNLIKTLENPIIPLSEKTLALRILDSDYSTENDIRIYSKFLYLLESPDKSPLLNHSWDSLTELKKNPDLRERIIRRIEKLQTIPDKTFKNITSDQHFYLAQNILNNFPEFSTLYASKCLKFLNGKTEINPTFYCQNFYRILKSTDYNSISPLAFESLNPYFKDLKSIR